MKYIKLMLVVLLSVIGLGYRCLNTFASSGIYYDNIDYTDNVSFNSVEGVNIDYSANLVKPGDYYELYFDVVNSTGYNVAIADCVYNEDNEYIDYELSYEDGSQINIGDIIKKGEKKRIKYKVLYKSYIMEESYTFDTSFSILYAQIM